MPLEPLSTDGCNEGNAGAKPQIRAWITAVAEWHQVISEPTFADAILDPIVHNAHRIALDGPSMRQIKADKISTAGIDQTEGK